MIVLIFSKYFINKDKDRRAAVKKFLIIMFSIVVLVGIGASIYVSTIDWNQHKDGIASQSKEITGKPQAIASTSTIPKPSNRELHTNMELLRYSCSIVFVRPFKIQQLAGMPNLSRILS